MFGIHEKYYYQYFTFYHVAPDFFNVCCAFLDCVLLSVNVFGS